MLCFAIQATYKPKEKRSKQGHSVIDPCPNREHSVRYSWQPNCKSLLRNISKKCSAWPQLLLQQRATADPMLICSPSYCFLLSTGNRRIIYWNHRVSYRTKRVVTELCTGYTYQLLLITLVWALSNSGFFARSPMHLPIIKNKNLRSTSVGWFFQKKLQITLTDINGLAVFADWAQRLVLYWIRVGEQVMSCTSSVLM